MMDSRWAKQVGVRADRLRDRIKALAWDLKYKVDRDKINDMYAKKGI
jgi:hypothetical protein